MNRKISVLMMTVICGLGFGQEGSFSLFLESDPIGAFIEVNGVAQENFTPVLLRDLPLGEHRILVFKDGFDSVELVVKRDQSGVYQQAVSLPRRYAAMAFPEEDNLFLVNQEVESLGNQYLVKEGDYSINFDENNQLRIEPIFPEEGMLNATTWSLFGTVSLAGLMTFQDLESPWNNKIILSPTTILTYGLLAWNIGYNLALRNQKDQFLRRLEASEEVNAFPPALAEILFSEGVSFQNEGNLQKALESFVGIAESYPDSRLYPSALFRMARIHTLQGLIAMAEAEYRLIATYYQQSDVYDLSQRALADLAFGKGEMNQALFHLDQITYFGNTVDEAEVAEFRAFVLSVAGEDFNPEEETVINTEPIVQTEETLPIEPINEESAE
jgi:tetratricopeptide (TPR) repeat protein